MNKHRNSHNVSAELETEKQLAPRQLKEFAQGEIVELSEDELRQVTGGAYKCW